MSRAPYFSCVIPVKGERPFFSLAVDSLRAQGIGDELEIIIQDAGSPSGGEEELGVLGLRGVEWVRELDAGQSDALNKGFAKAKGEWLFWLNADDVLLPRALKKVLFRLKRNAKVEWIAGNQLLIDDASRVQMCSVGNGWDDWLYHHAVPHVYGPSAFFRRELLEKVGGFDTSLKYCMDWDLWIKFMKAGAKFERIPEYIWGQRQWEGSKTQRRKTKEEDDVQWAEIHRMLEKNGMDVTALGNFVVRLWRMLNGNIMRQTIDSVRFRGKHYSEVMR